MYDEDKNESNMDWLFDDPENVAVFTSTQIINDGKPILRVLHDDEDGAWQFHSGNITTIKEAMVVALKEIYEINPSIAELAKMPTDYIAERENINSKWVINKIVK